MRVRLLLCAAVAAAAPAWLPSEPGASCLPDPFEGLDDERAAFMLDFDGVEMVSTEAVAERARRPR